MHDYYNMDNGFTFHKICDYLEETHKSTDYSSHQYKTSTAFSRFVERTYASFITSHFAVSLISKIYNSKSEGPVARFVRGRGIPAERKKSDDYQYNMSRKALNYSSPEDIKTMMERYSDILENCKKYIER